MVSVNSSPLVANARRWTHRPRPANSGGPYPWSCFNAFDRVDVATQVTTEVIRVGADRRVASTIGAQLGTQAQLGSEDGVGRRSRVTSMLGCSR